MAKINLVATHERPHLDEIFAIWLLKKFGEKIFAGIEKAKVCFLSDNKAPGGRTAEQCEAEGILLIGVGGGRFDEHPTVGNGRKENECAASLVARALGLTGDMALSRLLDYVSNNDLKGGGGNFDLAQMVRLLHRQYPKSGIRVMQWSFEAIEAAYQEQKEFFTETKAEYEAKARVEKIERGDVSLSIAIVESDNELMSRFARSEFGCDAAVVIQRKSTGHTQIFTGQKYKVDLRDVVQTLRLEEQKAKGKVVTTDWKVLGQEGKVEGVEEWFYFLAGQQIFNGSLTAKNIPPTRLSFRLITKIVLTSLNQNEFESARSPQCLKGHCSSSPKSECPWYRYGLHRCRQIRFEEAKARGKVKTA